MKGYILVEYNMNEKRNFHRFDSTQPVRYQLKDPTQFGGSLSCDLSEGGIRLHLSDFIPLNTELTLTLQLADQSIVECPCRVAWVEKNRFSDRYQAGLEFVEADSMLDSQRKIHGFLSRQK
jgi:c-di-GMP-binding flagellar brake protein YcgR